MEQMPRRIIPSSQADMPLCNSEICPVCGEAVECVMTQANRDFFDRVAWFPGVKVGETFPAPCRCEKEKQEKKHDLERLQKIARERSEHLRQRGLSDPIYRDMTFSADRGYNPATSTIARNYVENFDFMLANHIGLLFTGDVGTGKTFIASCIVNDLIDKGVSAMMIRLSRIINADLEGAAHILRIIEQSDLVVFDDVGAERDTSFAHERAFMAIDTRILARKPIIVTTNLTFEELAGVTDRMLKRIYDRIIGECVHVPIIGHSIRKVEQVQKTESARGLLLGDLKNTS